MTRKNERVLGTTASIRGKALQVLRDLGADDHHTQFRVICKCRGLTDANRKCEALGLGYNLFHRDYCTETGVQHEIDLCEKEDIWIRIGNNGSYYSAVEVVEKAKNIIAAQDKERNDLMDMQNASDNLDSDDFTGIEY